jgi:hypothetical protein
MNYDWIDYAAGISQSIGQYVDMISDLKMQRGSSIQGNNTGAAFSGNDIGGYSTPGSLPIDFDSFKRKEAGSIHQILIDGNAAFIVNVSLCNDDLLKL